MQSVRDSSSPQDEESPSKDCVSVCIFTYCMHTVYIRTPLPKQIQYSAVCTHYTLTAATALMYVCMCMYTNVYTVHMYVCIQSKAHTHVM